jgi:hypothetical protein
MRSSTPKTLIAIALIVAGTTFGNGAMAATIHAKPAARTVQHVATRYRAPAVGYAFGSPPAEGLQMMSNLLASPFLAPYIAQYGGRTRIAHGGSAGGYESSPSYDNYSAPDNSANDAAAAAATQQANDESAAEASSAASAAQTAADDAAMTQQIENNNGM